MGRWNRATLVITCTLALAGCQRDAASEAQGSSEEIFASSDAIGALALQPLSLDEVEEHPLAGDLGCTFADNPAASPLLLARGLVASPGSKASALAKFADAVVEGRAVDAGGYDALVDGGSFDTAALTIDVARITDEAGRADPSGRAALRVRQAGQGDVVMQGYWTCGV